MTLALYGKSRKRQGGLLLAALLAVLGAAVGGLMLIGTAFAHNTAYTKSAKCDGSWTAKMVYENGGGITANSSDRRLVLIRDVSLNGTAFAASWANASADPPPNDSGDSGTPTGTNRVIARGSYASSLNNLPAATGHTDYLWVGNDPGFTIFDQSGTGPVVPGNWTGSVSVWKWDGSQWVDQNFTSTVIAPPAATDCATITIKKVVNDGAPAQNFTASINNSHGSDGESSGATFSVATKFTETFANSHSDSNFTIKEVSIPLGWANDAYAIVNGADGVCPTYGQSGGAWTTSGDPKLSNLGNNSKTVCFKNTYTPPTGKVQVHKYLPQANGQPWQNVGNGQSSYEFTIYKDQAMTQPVTTFSQLGTNSGDVPQDIDLWIKETGTNGQAFVGFFFPDGNGDTSGNAKCNQQPANGSTFDSSIPTKIAKTRWGTPGNLTGLLHICAYNKPVPSLSITKTADAASVTAGNPVGFTITITNSNATAASGVSLADTLPAGTPALTWVVDTTAATTLTGCSITGGTALACTAQPIAGNTSKKVHVTANTSVAQQCAQQTLDNTAHYSYGGNTFDSNQASITINCAVVGAPSISKTKADSAFDGTKAYWTITINNTASAVALTGVVVTDTGAHLESTTPANACTGTDITFTCAVAAQGTTVLKVSKPLGTYNQCRGTSIDNSQISAVIPGVTTPTPSYTSTLITVPGDDTACGVPTISKAADPADSTTTAAAYKIVIDNSTSEVARTVVITDAGVTWPSPLPTGCTAVPSHADQVSCVVPAGGTTTIVVTVAVNATCQGTEATNTATAYYLNDAGAQVTIPNTSASNVKSSSLADAASCTQHVVFTKIICPSYAVVPGNDSSTSIDQSGHGAELAHNVTKPVTPILPAGCTLAPGWQFNTYSAWNGSTDPATAAATGQLGGPYTTGAGGSVDVVLSTAELNAALSGNGLWVQEVRQDAVAHFATLRCYNDLLNGDNLERIDLQSASTAGVNCVAYNVKPPRTVEVCKVIDQNNDGIADDGTFKFDVRSTAPNGTTFAVVTLTATEGGEQVCDTVTVPDNSQSSAIEVVEWATRPAGWGSDASGYPKISVNGGALSSNGTANLGNTGNGTVTFHNEKTPTDQHVTFIKVVCANYKDVPANLPVDGIGWGTNDMPAGYDQNSLGAAGPAGANDPVTPANIPGNCVTVPGWNFDLKDSGGTFFRTVTTAGSIGSAGIDVTLTPAELQSALQPWHDANGYHGLYVSEQKQTGYGFAALKCYKDHKLLDNTDGINLAAAGTEGVYCIAYNVADPVTVGVAKSNNLDGSQVSAGASFNWTITVTVGGAPTVNPVHVSDSLPTGFSITNLSAPDFACVSNLTTSVDCTLASGAAVGTHTITVTVTAPKPDANVCKPYTNTVNIGDLVFDERLLSQVALGIPRAQNYNPDTATNDVTVKDCTGTLHIIKKTQGATDPHGATFSGTVDNLQAWGPLTDGGMSSPLTVIAGGHTIQESPASQDPTLWTAVGLNYATGANHTCPVNPDNALTIPQVGAGQDVYVCVYNLRKNPDQLTGTVKIIKAVTGNNPDPNQLFTVQAGGQSDSIKNNGSTTFNFAFSTDSPTTDVTNVGEPVIPANYTRLGYRVIQGGALSCDSDPATLASLVATVPTLTISAQHPAYTVCVYNQGSGAITVTKTTTVNGLTDNTQRAGWQITVSSAACAVNQTKSTDVNGVASFPNLPTCNDYVVSENINSLGVGVFTPVSPSSFGGVAVTAGGNAPVNFTNNRFVPPPLCLFGCSPLIITTPTATPTTPTPTLTTKPTEPTKTEKPEEPKKTPTTNIDIVGGEKTPGPGANATPLAPSTGSGLFGTGKSASNLLLAVMGVFALSAGFAVIAVANKGKSRS